MIPDKNELSSYSVSNESFISFGCYPHQMKIIQGTKGLMTCTVENKSPKTIESVLGCTGLSGTGIKCIIDEEGGQIGKILVKESSDKNFRVFIDSRSSPPVTEASYTFTLSAVCVDNGSCYKE